MSKYDIAKQYGISIKNYDIIYKLRCKLRTSHFSINLQFRQKIPLQNYGLSGVVKNNQKARIVRDGVVVYNGSIKTLQHEKDQVKEVKKDMDCGLTLENCQDYKEKDIIEAYELVEIKR